MLADDRDHTLCWCLVGK